MATYSNQQLNTAIMNGDEEILFYLSRKYYQSARRWLRRNGCPDKETPAVFGNVIISVTRELQQSKISANLDFEQYFFNSLREYYKNGTPDKNHKQVNHVSDELEIVASCFSILDESARKILAARYAEKLSFEEIAVRYNFSNPVIAQFEVNRAFSQYENVSKARLNVTKE